MDDKREGWRADAVAAGANGSAKNSAERAPSSGTVAAKVAKNAVAAPEDRADAASASPGAAADAKAAARG